MALLELNRVSVMLSGRNVLRDISLSAERGALIALAGPNGAGKSTLLKAIAGVVPFSGAVQIDGVHTNDLSPGDRARRLAFLAQGRVAHWPMTVERVVALGRLPYGRTGPSLTHDDADAVERAMQATDAVALRDRRIDQLSGGERARALLARALAGEASILLADEPTEALDPSHRLQIMDALRRETQRGALVIAAMHDLALAAQYADRAILIDRGALVAYGAAGEVLSLDRIAQVYGVRPVAGASSPLGPRWEIAPSS